MSVPPPQQDATNVPPPQQDATNVPAGRASAKETPIPITAASTRAFNAGESVEESTQHCTPAQLHRIKLARLVARLLMCVEKRQTVRNAILET